MDDPEKAIQIGATLHEEEAKASSLMIALEFKELFAWKPVVMPGISKEVISQELNIILSIRSIAQKRCPVGEQKAISIRQEVGKLVDVNFVKEIRFETWVTNSVLLKKC